MHFVVGFNQKNRVCVAYARWDENDPANVELHLCLSKGQVDGLISTVKEGLLDLAITSQILPLYSDEPMVSFVSDVAATLASMIATLKNDGVQFKTLSSDSDLSGFWEPPTNLARGILVWVDPEVHYHVAVVCSKEQARSVIRGLADWMGPTRRSRLLTSINAWPIPNSSPLPQQNVEGHAAELIHWASLYAKMKDSMRR